MKRITCESCGHVNPEGTVLCEACGKPIEKNQHIDGNKPGKLLNMRYEGSARRSQTYNKSVIDKIWNFFSSVKVGVTLIVITLIASAVGTIFPQEMYIPPNVDPAQHYADQYGILGKIYYQLGLHNLYSSWWYMILIAMIGTSIIIASIDRYVPLRRALKMQKPKRHKAFLQKQRLFSETENISNQAINHVKDQLKKQRYKIKEQDGHILAEKGRFSRWGPYVNHIGLIVFLIGALMRFIPFMYIDDYVWVREGETAVVPETDQQYYVENKDFIMETYDENDERYQEAIQKQGGAVPSNYQTDAVIYKASGEAVTGEDPELEKVKEGSIQVNKPLKFDGYALYQSSYQLDEFKSMTFKIHETDDEAEEALASFTVNLMDPEYEYELDNGFRVVIDQYFPEYYMDDGTPASQSKYPRNPAFVFFVYPPGEDTPEVSFAGIGRNVDASGENDYKVGLQNFEVRDVTGLTLKRDYTLPIIALGGLIFMIGVIQGMYWQHRRVWIHPSDSGVMLAAHTNKNWYGIKREIEKAIEGTELNMVEDQQELKQ
ncbi:cytochrome C biogenesis protein [Sediminibacillus dalangtanensis]|uniref:Cytochrome C biogenesis protein n=1 Tax=Sediminibacillus dalangtanensis TaxID=2729421 RepID=A0ABX7VT62_9BACI|nr:cytochrome c biogenesis protein ResB [Sediminibacillus dalangtanensis]QTM99698.1 cytochrome C biogenesis protein [Sediminibacillus dalangtanensis]